MAVFEGDKLTFCVLFVEVGNYLLAESFLSQCLSMLTEELKPERCLFYLKLAREICCLELRRTVFDYLSRNLLELSQVVRYHDDLLLIAFLQPSA